MVVDTPEKDSPNLSQPNLCPRPPDPPSINIRSLAAASIPGCGDLGLVLLRALPHTTLLLDECGVEESLEGLELCLGLGVPDEVWDLVPVHHGGVAVEVGGVGVRLAAVTALERLRVPTQVAVDGRQRLGERETW